MAKKDRGFASIPAHKRHEIASKGGKVAHQRKREAAALARSM